MKKAQNSILSFIAIMSVVFSSLAFVSTEAYARTTKGKTTYLVVGEDLLLSMNVPKSYTNVKWRSSNKKIAKVDAHGYVVAKKKGTVKIIGRYKGKDYFYKVVVENPSISKTDLTLYDGESYTLKLKGTKQKVSWSTDDSNVATVSKGKISAIRPGSTTITASIGEQEKRSYKCKVTVNEEQIPDTEISKEFVKVNNGVVAIITNNSSSNIHPDVKIVFRNEYGEAIDTETNEYYQDVIYPNTKGVYYIECENFSLGDFATYDATVDIKKTFYNLDDKAGTISYSVREDDENSRLVISYKNVGTNNLSGGSRISVLFYDDNNCIDYSEMEHSMSSLVITPGYEDTLCFYYPYSEGGYNKPASYIIYISGCEVSES